MATLQRMANMDIVIDQCHFPNHGNTWCKTNCNPYKNVHLQVSKRMFVSFLQLHGKVYFEQISIFNAGTIIFLFGSERVAV